MEKKKDSDFDNFEFIQDNSILTSVEDYAMRVKREADEYSKQQKARLEGLSEEVEKKLEDAKITLEKAQAEAETMISQAQGQSDEIKQKAHEEGFQSGFEEGKQKALEEGNESFEKLENIFLELKRFRIKLFKQHEKELVRMCLLVARKIVHEELTKNKELVIGSIKSVLKELEGMTKIKVKVHPIDYDFIMQKKEKFESMLDEEQKLSIKADETAGPGTPIIESDFVRIDLDMKKQFSVLDAAFRECADERALLYKQEIDKI